VGLTQVLQGSDLLALRDSFRKLEAAVAASDLASVDSAASELRSLMERFGGVAPSVLERDIAMVRQVDASSESVSAILASRLRAFEIAIAAWQDPDPRRSK
jgi:hypothetical protein